MVPLGNDDNKESLKSVSDWQAKLYNDDAPPKYELNETETIGTYPPKKSPPPPPPTNNNNSYWSNNWSKSSSYSITQLRNKAKQIYGIENASFVKKENFTATVNAAV